MSLVINANMKLFADRMNITSSRMIRDYGLSTIDEIIEAEAERGNTSAVNYARSYYHSPEKLIEIFKLTNVENKFVLINSMNDSTRRQLLPLLEQEDLLMGMYFFTQEKLLEMLMKVDIEELVRVVQEAFPLEQIVMMFPEEDLAEFMQNKDLDRTDVMEQIKIMPPDMLQQFIEGVTGMPMEQTGSKNFINSLEQMSDEHFQKFMAQIDPDVQRQLTFQLTKEEPKYLNLFSNECYVNMLNTLMKPEMVKPMIMLNKETMVTMLNELPDEMMSIVAAQIDPKEFAEFLQDGHMDLLEKAMMI